MEKQSEIERNTEEESPDESNPLSPTSSPSHEFSFTISLHPQSKALGRNKSRPSFDLSPADKIFFHGHLLPQHYLSNLPIFPRYSIDDSFDSFTLPIDGFSGENNSSSRTYTDQEYISIDHINPSTCQESCSCVLQEEEVLQKQENESSVPQENFFLIVGEFAGKKKQELSRGRRREFSAPASMRNSPTNSGLLVASGTPTPSARDSTMEELQAAIQSAIAHCKKSIAAEETILVK
ncbi:BRI1 kinase inhibitor 1-like [Primulina eburnea]|uniref:BRI1 kinase inhibitor 1-like n=1 Tax=Primulina eburnea TaxID=1245227 RepID=UPI003C6C5593